MVEHIVLFKLKPGTSLEDKNRIVSTLQELRSMDGILACSVGLNHSQEGKSAGFEVGMRIGFVDQAALDAYLPHPQHVGTVDQVRALFADVIVLDYTHEGTS